LKNYAQLRMRNIMLTNLSDPVQGRAFRFPARNAGPGARA